MNRFLPAVALLALVSGCDNFSTAHAYCAHVDECLQEENVDGDNDDSDDGSDDVAVCTQGVQAIVDSFSANSEPECKEAAAAYEQLLRCLFGLSCDALVEGTADEACEDENDAFQKLSEDIAEDEIDCELLVR